MREGDVSNDVIGFIGLGNIGYPMAENVVDSGFRVLAFDVRDEPLVRLEEAGGERADSVKELAVECSSIHISVRNDEQLEAIVLDEGGIFEALDDKARLILVVHSTVMPETCKRLADEAHEGITVIDAPVSGAAPRAKAGTLSIMAGGDETALDAVRPVFDAVAEQIFHVGELGTGQVAKLTNNAIFWSNMMATAEGLKLGKEYGIPQETLLDIVGESSGDSFAIENWEYFSEELGEVYPSGYEGFADIGKKDLMDALELAQNRNVELVGTAVASQVVPSFWREQAED